VGTVRPNTVTAAIREQEAPVGSSIAITRAADRPVVPVTKDDRHRGRHRRDRHQRKAAHVVRLSGEHVDNTQLGAPAPITTVAPGSRRLGVAEQRNRQRCAPGKAECTRGPGTADIPCHTGNHRRYGRPDACEEAKAAEINDGESDAVLLSRTAYLGMGLHVSCKQAPLCCRPASDLFS